MEPRGDLKTTFDIERVIQPIYSGGSVALDENGQIMVTCLGEEAVLLDLASGRSLARIDGDGEIITSLCITPSASQLIICSRSLSLRIYALTRSEGPERDLIPALQRTFKPHLSPVITTAIDATGTLLATGAADGILKVWDIQGGYATHTFKGHSGIISALHFFEVTPPGADDGGSSSGKTTASRKKRRAREEAGQEGQKRFRLASGSEDGKVRVWDLINRSCVSVLDSHVSVVRGLDYSAEERALVSGSRDKTIIVWDARTWKTRLTIPVLEGVESAGFVARGKIAYTGGEHGKVRLWSVESGQEISQEQEVGGEGDSIVQIVYPHGQDWLLSVHADQSLLLHSLQSVLACSENVSLPPLPVIQRISGSHDEIIDLAYLMPDQSLLALATNSEDVRIVSVASPSTGDGERDAVSGNSQFGADIALLKGHEDIVICLDADWSGRWLATGAKDNTARLWHVDPESSNFTCFAIFTGHAESIGAIALPRSIPSSSAKRAVEADQPPALLLTGSQDQTIKCWTVLPNPQGSSRKRPASAQARYTRKAHDKDINAIDVNHNNTLFASASQDRTVKVWSVDGGEVQGVLRGHRRGVWSVRFAPKAAPSLGYGGSRGLLLTGSGDKTVKIWSVADYSCLRTLEGHTNSVLRVVWLPLARHDRGLRLASAGSDGLVKVWEAHTGEVSCTLDNHTDRIWALAVKQPDHHGDGPTTTTDDGADAAAAAASPTVLVSGGGDGVVTFWRDTTAATAAAASAAATQHVELDQRLQNFIQARAYREAITLALQINHPGRLLALFQSVIHGSGGRGGSDVVHDPASRDSSSLSGRQVIDDVLASLADDQLYTLLLRLRDWNTNARTAPVAQRVLWVLFQLYPVERFVELDAGRRRLRMSGGGGGVEAGAGPGAGAGIASQPQRGTGEKGGGGGGGGLFDALRAYTERHYTRLSDLMDESYLLEYTLSEMDGLGAVVVVDAAAAAAADDDHRDDGRKRNGERDGDADGDGVEAMDVVGESGAEEEDEDDVDVDVDGEGDGDGDGDHDVVMSSAAL